MSELKNSCRLCAKSSNPDTDNVFSNEDQSLIELIQKYLSITITTNDVLPSNVCESCRFKLITFDEYAQKCSITQIQLISAVEKYAINQLESLVKSEYNEGVQDVIKLEEEEVDIGYENEDHPCDDDSFNVSEGSSQKNKSSNDLFDSTYISTTNNEGKSDSGVDYSGGTDANYAPSVHDITSDDSSMEGDEAVKRIYQVDTDFSSPSGSPTSPYSLLEQVALLDKHIEDATDIFGSDSSHVSNSPYCKIISVKSEFIEADRNKSPSINNINTVTSQHDVAVHINNDTRGGDCANKDMISNLQPENKVIRGKDFCFYCESLVLNFARHLLRHHVYESEVQKILSVPKKSLKRKSLIMKLRKKGNFIQNSVEVTKPVRKQKFTDYLPCTNCLGFYSKRLLWKHKKKCTGQNAKNVQSEAQNLLVRNLTVDEKLKNTVFSRMRADKISLVAKSDVLICEFGSQYLKTHRKKHFVNVVSRKMREMAKLLIQVRKNNPSVKDFFDALRPENYDDIVSATKVVGKYDSKKDRFDSPTFAMNISTSIKQCCNIAIMLALKKQGPYMDVNTSKTEASLKTLIQLIDSNWKFDISSQAANDLNKKRWNKVTIITLANDLKILKQFLNKRSEEAANKIKEGSFNIGTYVQLLQTIYCRVLLLNRRRPGELQKIKVHDFLESDNNNYEKYEEFNLALTTSERVLLKKLKRVVIRGRRGRGLPVLFNKEAQEDIKLLLTIREKFVSRTDKLLFGNPGFENSIYGYKVLERYSRLSGAKNPKAISSARLRKHLAKLSQIFSMTKNDMEQLATFMGHTNEVRKKSYRLLDDVYQTAKISKLLILMEDGKADAYRGKCLDEIDLDLNEELEEGNIENEEISDYDLAKTQMPIRNCVQQVREEPQPGPSGLRNKTSKFNLQMTLPSLTEKNDMNPKKRILVPWTTEQKKVVSMFFKCHIKNKQSPKRNECETLKEQHPELLINKDWLKIKVFVQNTYSKK